MSLREREREILCNCAGRLGHVIDSYLNIEKREILLSLGIYQMD